ncbi:MAG: tripartite tricarboxylate transporter substrate binding protein [Rhodospirillales bacterium]|nr:tripartite tricarboxylate transporter substrate binding protein [Rhodospirillales bacterium]
MSWPQRPVTLVLPLAPGGSTDTLIRALAQHLTGVFGQSFVIDNRPGAGGTIAHGQIARARPDGYTLLVSTNSTYAIAPHLYQLAYDTETAFAPVTLIASTPQVLCVHKTVPVTDLAGLLAYARAHPGQLTFSSAGIGFTSHLAAELFMSMAGVSMLHVPYRGGGPAAQALMAGEVQVNFADTLTAQALVQGGNVRALAVTGGEESRQFPGLPTLDASGMPGYRSATAYALLAPAETPAPILDALQQAVAAWLRIPERREWLLSVGFVPIGSTAAEFHEARRTESAMWGDIIRTRGITMP